MQFNAAYEFIEENTDNLDGALAWFWRLIFYFAAAVPGLLVMLAGALAVSHADVSRANLETAKMIREMRDILRNQAGVEPVVDLSAGVAAEPPHGDGVERRTAIGGREFYLMADGSVRLHTMIGWRQFPSLEDARAYIAQPA